MPERHLLAVYCLVPVYTPEDLGLAADETCFCTPSTAEISHQAAVENVPCLQQQNAYDCGVFVLGKPSACQA